MVYWMHHMCGTRVPNTLTVHEADAYIVHIEADRGTFRQGAHEGRFGTLPWMHTLCAMAYGAGNVRHTVIVSCAMRDTHTQKKEWCTHGSPMSTEARCGGHRTIQPGKALLDLSK
eukprot:scaffold20823_cov27-Tisochrysis_lutea.AAC.2